MDLNKKLESYLRLSKTGCILWTGYSDPDRGPRFTYTANGRNGPTKHVNLRRWAYEQAWGYYPKRLYNTCDNPTKCVNPQHFSEEYQGRSVRNSQWKLKHLRSLADQLEVECAV